MPAGGNDRVYSAVDQAVFAGLQDGEGVIVDTQSAFYFGLNKTASFLWERLQKDQEVTAQTLCDALCSRFEVSREQAAQDVDAFLAHVVKYGLAKTREISLNK